MKIKRECYYDKSIECVSDGPYCQICKHMPEYDDMKNGKNEPVELKFEAEYDGNMYPVCPSCGEMPYSYERCVFCGQKFIQGESDKPKLELEHCKIKGNHIQCDCGCIFLTLVVHSDAVDYFQNEYRCDNCGGKCIVREYRRIEGENNG